MVKRIVQDPARLIVHDGGMGLPESTNTASPSEMSKLVDDAIGLVERWLREAPELETKQDKATASQLQELIEDPDGVAFTMGFVDRVARPDSNVVAAQQLSSLVQSKSLPSYLSTIDRFLLRAGAKVGEYLPQIVMPLARRRMRQIVGHMVVDAETKALRSHLEERRSAGYDLNVNLLGEAVLGEREADKRMRATVALLREPSIDYVSIKLSSVVPQLNYWAWDDSRSRVLERLVTLFDAAAGSGTNTFINLDMEEYHDLELTVSVFVQVIGMDRFSSVDAGIVLQAYLPDSFAALKQVVEAANQRKAAGGGDVKIRLVKGANLAMEKVEAALHGWEQAPYRTKAETDANYKRLVDWVLTPANTAGVRIGIGSHNLFDIAFARLLAEKRGVANRVEFEMLQGMAPGEARAVKNDHGSLLLYTPIVGQADFDVAISYLFRRLEENSAEDNFLRILFSLKPDTPLFTKQANLFRASVTGRHQVGSGPQRSQSRQLEGQTVENGAPALQLEPDGFRNTADSDPALAGSRAWAAQVMVRAAQTHEPNTPMTTDVQVVAGVVTACRSAQPGWFVLGGEGRQAVLLAVAVEMERRRGDLIAAMVAEAFKTFEQADVEVSEAIDFARYYGDRAADLDQASTDGMSFEPYGVMAIVPPWNFPVAIPAGGVLASLAAGNAVVLKPAPETPRCAEIVAECCWAAGVPREVLGFLRTPDNEVGQALITSVDGVILTGSSETAAMFLEWKPELRLLAETSGKNALIITPSADLDLAVQDLVRSAFGHSGQKCSAASLAILVGDVYDSARFRNQLIDAVQSLVVGPSDDLATMVNPTILPVEGKLKRGLTQLDRGETWVVEPRLVKDFPPDQIQAGTLWSPGVRDGVSEGSWFHQTECFGPVLGLMFAPDLATAIRLANGNDFGLTGGIHSLDPAEIQQWLEQVQVGNAYVNRQITGAIVQRQPFGGWKKSAVGPGVKAGGPNYVAQLGTWTDAGRRDQAWLDHARASDAYWAAAEFDVDHDPSALFCEANILRYRPLSTVMIRVGTGANPFEVQRVRDAANRMAKMVLVSSVESESDEQFADSLGGVQLDRVRVVGEVGDVVRRAAAAKQIHLADQPVTANGRLELLPFCREQAISRTLHRFGNLVL